MLVTLRPKTSKNASIRLRLLSWIENIGSVKRPRIDLRKRRSDARYSDREAKAFMSRYERIILNGVGHFPHRERPGQVNDLLLVGVTPHLPARLI